MKNGALHRYYAPPVLLIAALLSACGQYGDLYLPDEPPGQTPPEKVEAPAPIPATPSTEP